MTADLFRVIARFENAEGRPFFGSEYEVSLLDKDRLFDDKLGATTIREDGNEVFRSEVFPEVSFDATDPVTGRQDNLTREFGPFRVSG